MLTIDPAQLPTHFQSKEAEEKWCRTWDDWQIYHYDATRPRKETFVVDTPPPTVSGSLHIGHVFSYTQTDIIVRYQRMCGRNIFYPMGWDDNGLPTERRVQNYFHVRCDLRTPYEPGLKLEAASSKDLKETPPRNVSRQNFIELCLQLTREDEKAFTALWKRLGLSVDWRQEYSTIDDHCRRLAQFSFIDLYKKGHVYSVEAPTMWDVDFQTAVAQAEVEDRELPGMLHHVRFGIEGSDKHFTIATTRPELLPACVGVTAHPNDERYKSLFGKKAITPLFFAPVPIFPSELADPDKGTGILMVCTFGDANDVFWWRQNQLPLRQTLGRNGRFDQVAYGQDGWESLKPAAANAAYQQLAGKTVKTAQKIVVDMLRDASGAATGNEPPLTDEPRPIQHAVKFFEKGDRPLEFISTKQWFVRLLDKKNTLIDAGERIAWHPDFMRVRYRNWTENLQQDWCISRQRFFGVPFPLWYPLDGDGKPDFSRHLLADIQDLPVDPSTAAPRGYKENQRGVPNGFIAESDVFDTWFTSSLTPQICSQWQVDEGMHSRLFPMDLRPQSHEIIRTWAFYTVVKSLLHEDNIPWSQATISGWILDPDRKKMSKSKGNVMTPMHLLDEYGSDGVRYWAASARLGADTAFDEQVLKVGKRLVTKLLNAGKFVLSQTGVPAPISSELDIAFMHKLHEFVTRVTELNDNFEYATGLKEINGFFWNNFTDSLIELVKGRAKDETLDARQRGSAITTLRRGLSVFLRLFAPVVPYITEEVWSWAFAEETGIKSIHRAPWPGDADFTDVPSDATSEVFDLAVNCWAAINKYKAQGGVTSGRPIEKLSLAANSVTAEKASTAMADVMAAARARSYTIAKQDTMAEGEFEVLEATFAETV